jgi:hypothetical protein
VDDKRGSASVLGSVITLNTSVGRPRPEHQPLLHRREAVSQMRRRRLVANRFDEGEM